MSYLKPPVGATIHYLDVKGKQRRLTCVEHPVRTVKWHKQKPQSLVSLYECEDGHVIQVPDNAWGKVRILSVRKKKGE
jgi:hypothetical protein